MSDRAPTVSSARRSVAAATALVAGQLALCVLIGWLTVSGGPSGPGPVRPGADALPVVAATPTRSTPPAARPDRTDPDPAPATPSGAGRPTPTASPGGPARTGRVPTAPTGEPPATVPAPPAPTPAGSGSARVGVGPPSATVRKPVMRNAACAPESALGRTAGGTPVRCERDDRRRLRWRRV